MNDSNDISVRVLDDGRRAELRVPGGFGAAQLTAELLRSIATDAHVQITPAVEQSIASVVGDFRANPRDITVDIARALEPVHGNSGSWAWEPRFDPAGHAAGAGGGDRVDHRASHVLSVTTGAVVARVTAAGAGTDGRSVTGAVLRARRGAALPLTAGTGLETRPDGTVVATKDGVLEVHRNVVTISPVLEVRGCVDFSTGHIDFKGSVNVADAVRDGFNIRATGGITVGGVVEGVELTCGGELRCPQGVASARRAKIVAGNAVVAFLRNVTALVRGDLDCKGELEHCDIVVGGECRCESGRVIGGSLVLTGAARIGTIGSPDWTPTLLCVGELPVAAMDLRRITVERSRLSKAIERKDEIIRNLIACGGSKSAQGREQLTELQYERSELQRTAAALEPEIVRLQEAMRQGAGVELSIAHVVHPKARIQHAGRAFEFGKEVKGPLQILLDKNGELFVQLKGQEPRSITDFAVGVPATPAKVCEEPARRCA